MKLTAEELAKVAHLSRLDWSKQAAADIGDSLDAILTYMETLNEVNTETVAPTVHAVELQNVWHNRHCVMRMLYEMHRNVMKSILKYPR